MQRVRAAEQHEKREREAKVRVKIDVKQVENFYLILLAPLAFIKVC
jgi:hypothetical protein